VEPLPPYVVVIAVDAQPGTRRIQVCTAVGARALVIISFIIGLSRREKQGRGAREERDGKRAGREKEKEEEKQNAPSP
jgi:hypothetical protein